MLSGSAAQGWSLLDGDGSVYTFNALGQPTSARSPEDATHPAAAEYIYDATVSPARVKTIHDPVSGRDIGLTYGPSSACGAVSSPRVWDAAPTNLLCRVDYWDGTATVFGYLRLTPDPGQLVVWSGGLVDRLGGLVGQLVFVL